jgi:hypothetical protein
MVTMTTMISRDRHWRVRTISIDTTGQGFQALLRIEHDAYNIDIPLHTFKDGPGLRTGPVRGPGGWFWVEDVTSTAEIERWVPLSELTEEPA